MRGPAIAVLSMLTFPNERCQWVEDDKRVEATLKTIVLEEFGYASQAPAGWEGFEGHINRGILDKIMPKPSDDAMVFICGYDGLE